MSPVIPSVLLSVRPYLPAGVLKWSRTDPISG